MKTHEQYQNIKQYSIILFLCVIMLAFISDFTPKAYADGINLKIMPSVLQIRAQAPSDIRAPFTIENRSNQSVNLKIGYRIFNAANSQEGSVVFLSNGNSGAQQKIFNDIQVVDSDNYALDSVALGPQQKKTLRLRIVLPPGQASNDYYFSLIFINTASSQTDILSTNPNKGDQSTASVVQGGIANNVLLAIGDPETARGSIEEFSTQWYRQAGPVPFTVRVKNNGLHFITPKGVIFIKNIFGQLVGRVDIPPTTILTNTSRTLSDINSIELGSPKVSWNEPFLFGFYTATISLAMSQEGPVYTQTVRFASFPILLIIGFLLIIAIAIGIILKIKRKRF